MKDALLKVTKYLPAAAANNTTDSIDLGVATTGERDLRAPARFLKITVPALPANSDNTKTILFDLHDSADDLTFTEVSPLIECKVPGVTTDGSAATTFRYPLPGVRQYIAIKCTVPSGAGDNTAVQYTAELEF